MSYKRFLITCIITFVVAFTGNAQDPVMKQVAAIKPMVSTKKDVIESFGNGEIEDNSIWFYFPDKSIEFIFSDGKCREDWLAPLDKVVKSTIFFRKDRPISDLSASVKLKKLRKLYTLHGDILYHDDYNGVMYEVVEQGKLWSSLTYYPSKKYSHLKC